MPGSTRRPGPHAIFVSGTSLTVAIAALLVVINHGKSPVYAVLSRNALLTGDNIRDVIRLHACNAEARSPVRRACCSAHCNYSCGSGWLISGTKSFGHFDITLRPMIRDSSGVAADHSTVTNTMSNPSWYTGTPRYLAEAQKQYQARLLRPGSLLQTALSIVSN